MISSYQGLRAQSFIRRIFVVRIHISKVYIFYLLIDEVLRVTVLAESSINPTVFLGLTEQLDVSSEVSVMWQKRRFHNAPNMCTGIPLYVISTTMLTEK